MNEKTMLRSGKGATWAIVVGFLLSSILVGAYLKRNHSANGFVKAQDDGYEDFLGI